MTCFWIHQNHQILWYPLIMLRFDQMNLKTLLLYSSSRGKKNKGNSSSRLCLAAHPTDVREEIHRQWVKTFLLEGLGSIKWCQCQVQPHISRNWNLMRLQAEKTVLMLIPSLPQPSAKLVSHANFHGSILITSSILIEKESELIEFFRTVGNFLVFTLLGLMNDEMWTIAFTLPKDENFIPFSSFLSFLISSFVPSFFPFSLFHSLLCTSNW